MIPSRLFDLFYGQTASGKSEAIRELIEFLLSQPGNENKIARIVVGDGSALSYDSLVEQGKVEILEFAHRPNPFYVLPKLSTGWWVSGKDPLDLKLIPPQQQPTRANVLIYVFEGITVMGKYVMGDIEGGLADQGGKGIKLGQDSPIQITQEGSTYGGNPMGHYNIAQNIITGTIQRSKGLAPYVIWTAHEATNDPEKSNLVKDLVVGPGGPGKALTANIPTMFNNTFHFQTVAKRGREKDEFTGRDMQDLQLDYRIWSQQHFSPDNNTMIRYLATTRGVKTMKEYYPSILALYKDLYEKARTPRGA